MGEEFCSEEVCSSVLEFSKGVLEQVFEEFEDAELERQYELLHTSSLQNSSPIPFNGHLLEVINAPANKWSLRAPWAPKLYRSIAKSYSNTRSRSKSWYTNSYSIGRSKSYSIKRDRSRNRSRIRLRDRSRIRLKETEVVIDCYTSKLDSETICCRLRLLIFVSFGVPYIRTHHLRIDLTFKTSR